MSELIGTTIDDRFEVVRAIGKGGYGDVFEARQLSVDRSVALKVVHPHLAARADVSARFRREAKLTSRLDHPNAIRVIDFGDDDGLLYLVMDFVSGPTLKEWLAEHGPVTPAVAASITADVASALHAAHAIGLVHRDLKPSNILLSEANGGLRPVVIDFGLVKVFGEDAPGHDVTASHMMIGTPAYMSPESVLGRAVDGRSDVYALGVVLYETLTGTRPFSGSTQMEIATARLHGPAPPLPDALPAKVRSLVADMLERDPDDRVATAEEVASRLRRWPRFGETPTRLMEVDRTIAPMRGPGVPAPLATSDAPAPAAAKPARRTHGATWAGLIVAACLALAGVVLGIGGDQSAESLETLSAPEIALPGLAPPAAEQEPADGGALALASSNEATTNSDGSATNPDDPTTDGDVAAPSPDTGELAEPDDEPAESPDHEARQSEGESGPEEPPRRRSEARRSEAPGSVRINAAPSGVVFVDGEELGSAPKTLSLPPGQYEVTTRYLGQEITEVVRVRSGETESVTHWHRERSPQ